MTQPPTICDACKRSNRRGYRHFHMLSGAPICHGCWRKARAYTQALLRSEASPIGFRLRDSVTLHVATQYPGTIHEHQMVTSWRPTYPTREN